MIWMVNDIIITRTEVIEGRTNAVPASHPYPQLVVFSKSICILLMSGDSTKSLNEGSKAFFNVRRILYDKASSI